MRRLLIFALGILLGLTTLVINTQTRQPAAVPNKIVRGVLLNVESTSLVYTDRVQLRDADGKTWTFKVAPEVATNAEEAQTSSHLRQHMALGEPMEVRYQEAADGPVAVRIFDAR